MRFRRTVSAAAAGLLVFVLAAPADTARLISARVGLRSLDSAALSFARQAQTHRAVAPLRARSTLSALDAAVLSGMNQIRVAHGLGALRYSARLTAAASQHSRSMASGGYFSHSSADGSSFDKRIARYYPFTAKLRYWSVGENLVWQSPDLSASEAVQLWMNSPEHRANILDSGWREVGVFAVHAASGSGVFGSGPVTTVTADFGVRR